MAKKRKGIRKVKPIIETTKNIRCEPYKVFPGVEQPIGQNQQILPFQTKPQLYNSLSRKTYIYKHDLFVKLQQIINLGIGSSAVLNPLIMFYLRTKSLDLKGKCELVEYDEKAFLELEAKMRNKFYDMPTVNVDEHSRKLTFSELFRKSKAICSENYRDPGYVSVYEHWKWMNGIMPIYEIVLKVFHEMMKTLDKFIERRRNWFKPHKQRKRTGKPIVRLFEDSRHEKFVFAWELLKEMGSHGVSVPPSVRTSIRRKESMDVLLLKEVFKMLGDQVKSIEFVQVSTNPIWASKPAGSIKYVPQIGKVLMKIINEEIQDFRVFHGVTKRTAEEIVNSFEETVHFFESMMIGPTLMKETLYNEMLPVMFHKLEVHHHTRTYGEPLQVGPRGFTTKDIKCEIKRVGLHRAFKNILTFSSAAQGSLLELNRERTTEKLQEIIGSIQTIWIVFESDVFQRFLHRTNYCGYMGGNCNGCRRQAEEDEIDARMARDEIRYQERTITWIAGPRPKNEQVEVSEPGNSKERADDTVGAASVVESLPQLQSNTSHEQKTNSPSSEVINDPEVAKEILNTIEFSGHWEVENSVEYSRLTLEANLDSEDDSTKLSNKSCVPATKLPPPEINAKKKSEKLNQTPPQHKEDHVVNICEKCAQLRNEDKQKLKLAEERINFLSKQLADLELLKIENERTIQMLKDSQHGEASSLSTKNKLELSNIEASESQQSENKSRLSISDSGVDGIIRNIENDVKNSKKLKLSLEMKIKLCELRGHLDDLKNKDPVQRATKVAEEIAGCMSSQHPAYGLLKDFKFNVEEYRGALKKAIEWIKNHPEANVDDVPTLPALPIFRIEIGKS